MIENTLKLYVSRIEAQALISPLIDIQITVIMLEIIMNGIKNT